ncbi:hypothetical protein Tco_0945725 [Tanacetum coccineum]
MLKFLQIFQRFHFDISFADALLHMPKFASTFKSLLSNKEKLFEMANTPLNENCSAMLLKKLPKKLGDPDKFLIPFDYDVDPRVPLILGRPFLRTARALIDVHEEDLILRDGDKQLIFHADSTSKHPFKHGNYGNPTPSSNFVVEFPSPSLIPYEDSDSLVKETDTLLSHFSDSSPDYETFCFDIEEKSNGSTTIHSDDSLPDYDALYFDDDHIEEKNNGSTTTHSDFSLPGYDSFIFDLLIDPFPHVDRSVSHHEEFADELAHILSPPEYDRFYFDLEADP